MNNQIKFIPISLDLKNTNLPPLPASKIVPSWFKNIPPERIDKDNIAAFGRNNGTVKKCIPYIDALTMGYMFVLPFDIEVSIKDNAKYLRWQVEGQETFAHVEPEYRTMGIGVNNNLGPEIWRLTSYPCIETPSGYSVLVTHPLNRYDLPFLTLSGVIDTDKLHQESSIAFYLNSSFSGILEKGTPIAQIIPFKRDEWSMDFSEPYPDKIYNKMKFDIKSIINRSYARQYWSKKKFN
jgi:hypothetical protein